RTERSPRHAARRAYTNAAIPKAITTIPSRAAAVLDSVLSPNTRETPATGAAGPSPGRSRGEYGDGFIPATTTTAATEATIDTTASSAEERARVRAGLTAGDCSSGLIP